MQFNYIKIHFAERYHVTFKTLSIQIRPRPFPSTPLAINYTFKRIKGYEFKLCPHAATELSSYEY
jgi:hypothetical protein